MYSIKKMKLRRLLQKDLPVILGWRNQYDVRKMMKNKRIISKKEHQNWFSIVDTENTCEWMVVEYDGQDVGVTGITNLNSKNKTCTWSMYLSPEMKNTGLGLLIEIKTIDRIVFEHKIKTIWGEALIKNKGVITIHKKCGFEIGDKCIDQFNKRSETENFVKIKMNSIGWKEKRGKIINEFNLCSTES